MKTKLIVTAIIAIGAMLVLLPTVSSQVFAARISTPQHPAGTGGAQPGHSLAQQALIEGFKLATNDPSGVFHIANPQPTIHKTGNPTPTQDQQVANAIGKRIQQTKSIDETMFDMLKENAKLFTFPQAHRMSNTHSSLPQRVGYDGLGGGFR